YRNVVPLAVGLGLFQIGEFSFLLARVGVDTKSIGNEVYSLVLTTAIITIVLTPFISGLSAPIYAFRKKRIKHEPVQTMNLPDEGLARHTVIAGGGRVGQHIATVLRQLNVPFVIIELNYRRLEECRKTGFPLIYGDASRTTVLEAAEARKARLMLLTTPAVVTAQAVVRQARALQPELEIIARCESHDQMNVLNSLGVRTIILPELEAGLEMARQSLIHLDFPISEIQNYTDQVRRELYAPFERPDQEWEYPRQLALKRDLLEMSWIVIPANCPLSGLSIKEAAIRSRTGVSIVGVVRKKRFLPNPKADFRLASGDILAIIGRAEDKKAFMDLIEKTS
ncbi:MAG: NAD-binding protein, partial [Deltaproteobacteria bacterium]|nr:NAD-binding protein [Deltaproteobacteria bacterium]